MLPIVHRVLLALALVAVPALLQAGQGLPETPLSQAHAKTCKHYENRAKFKPRGAGASLEVLLADSCARALHGLYGRFDASPHERRLASAYLDRLSRFKATIININMDRMFGAARTRATRIKVTLGDAQAARPSVQPITATGEYLIARRMGVLGAFLEWADAVDFETAGGR